MRLEERNAMVLKLIRCFSSSKVIREKRFILKSLSILILPDLQGSRYDLKRLTRVSLDSEHPKNLLGLCPTVLSQLGTKWLGWWQSPPTRTSMCVLGLEIACAGEV